MGLQNPDFESLAQIADGTGGTAAVANDAGQVRALFDSVQSTLRRQYVVTFPSRAEGGSNAAVTLAVGDERATRSEEHTSELQSLMRISYAVFCLKKTMSKQLHYIISTS